MLIHCFLTAENLPGISFFLVPPLIRLEVDVRALGKHAGHSTKQQEEAQQDVRPGKGESMLLRCLLIAGNSSDSLSISSLSLSLKQWLRVWLETRGGGPGKQVSVDRTLIPYCGH